MNRLVDTFNSIFINSQQDNKLFPKSFSHRSCFGDNKTLKKLKLHTIKKLSKSQAKMVCYNKTFKNHQEKHEFWVQCICQKLECLLDRVYLNLLQIMSIVVQSPTPDIVHWKTHHCEDSLTICCKTFNLFWTKLLARISFEVANFFVTAENLDCPTFKASIANSFMISCRSSISYLLWKTIVPFYKDIKLSVFKYF